MKKPTKEEKAYLEAVAELPCYVDNDDCGGRLEVHHKTGSGMGKRSSHFDTMPLCTYHHSAQSPLGYGHSIHNGTRMFEKRYYSQDVMIADTRARIERGVE